MAPGRAPFASGGAARADYPDYPYAPGAPPRPRREETYRKTWGALFGTAFILWMIHGSFHMESDWLRTGYGTVLGAAFGPTPIGQAVHVIIEAIIGSALGMGFAREVLRWYHS